MNSPLMQPQRDDSTWITAAKLRCIIATKLKHNCRKPSTLEMWRDKIFKVLTNITSTVENLRKYGSSEAISIDITNEV